MEKFLLISHVFCGGTVLTLGILQMSNRKGGKNHLILGRIYVGAMWWICLSALLIISFYRFSAFLMVIAVLTFYSSFTGVRVLRRKKIGSERWYDWVVAVCTALFGVALICYGINIYFNHNNDILSFLCIAFGFFTFQNAFQDLRFFFRKSEENKHWWLKQHIGAMGGSYVAAVTAFAVQNPDLFMPGSSYQWLLWILPAIIGSPIIAFVTRKWSSKSTSKALH